MIKAIKTEGFAQASPHQALCEGTSLGDEMIHKSNNLKLVPLMEAPKGECHLILS